MRLPGVGRYRPRPYPAAARPPSPEGEGKNGSIRPPVHLAIDARPRGAGGLLAVERFEGRAVLVHVFESAQAAQAGPIVIHADEGDQRRFSALLGERADGRVTYVTGPPHGKTPLLRTDCVYDPARLRRALRRGDSPETAVIWRLDGPHALAGAEDELRRRRSYQPLGRYWALAPARWLARRLCPTRVRPNALTLAAGGLMLGAAGGVAFAPPGLVTQAAVAVALALALVLDTADGHLARLQGTASEFGRWLDAFLDELADMALHAGMAWAAFVHSGQSGWLMLGMLYGMGKYQFVVGTTNKPCVPSPPARPVGAVGRGMGDVTRVVAPVSRVLRPWRLTTVPLGLRIRPRRMPPRPHGKGELVTIESGEGPASPGRNALVACVRLAGHADVRWHLWIVLAAVGRLDVALAAYSLYFPARAFGGAIRKAVRRG